MVVSGNQRIGGDWCHRRGRCFKYSSVTKHIIKRLARRGGVTCVCRIIYQENRVAFKLFLEKVIRDAFTSAMCEWRQVTATHVKNAFKRQFLLLSGVVCLKSEE
ncbi:hypothetical protein SNE40_014926 [Patella caerulea]|uniref:Histone H4 n=1 Tax=Patella caerulea TaxID=87958 RepID=A0AAN8JIX7_PATCE